MNKFNFKPIFKAKRAIAQKGLKKDTTYVDYSNGIYFIKVNKIKYPIENINISRENCNSNSVVTIYPSFTNDKYKTFNNIPRHYNYEKFILLEDKHQIIIINNWKCYYIGQKVLSYIINKNKLTAKIFKAGKRDNIDIINKHYGNT